MPTLNDYGIRTQGAAATFGASFGSTFQQRLNNVLTVARGGNIEAIRQGAQNFTANILGGAVAMVTPGSIGNGIILNNTAGNGTARPATADERAEVFGGDPRFDPTAEPTTSELARGGPAAAARANDPEGYAERFGGNSWIDQFGQRVIFGLLGAALIVVAVVFLAAPQGEKFLDVFLKLKGLGALDRVGRGGDTPRTTPTPPAASQAVELDPPAPTPTPRLVSEAARRAAFELERGERPDFGGEVIELPNREPLPQSRVFSGRANRPKPDQSGGKDARDIFSSPQWRKARDAQERDLMGMSWENQARDEYKNAEPLPSDWNAAGNDKTDPKYTENISREANLAKNAAKNPRAKRAGPVRYPGDGKKPQEP